MNKKNIFLVQFMFNALYPFTNKGFTSEKKFKVY
jgi:hypothetical protein